MKHGHNPLPAIIQWITDRIGGFEWEDPTGEESIDSMHMFRRICNRHN